MLTRRSFISVLHTEKRFYPNRPAMSHALSFNNARRALAQTSADVRFQTVCQWSV